MFCFCFRSFSFFSGCACSIGPSPHDLEKQQTQIFIETPYRNQALLEAMLSNCNGQTLVCVATDLTLASESIKTQTADTWKRDIAKGRLPDFHKKPTVFLFLAE